MGPLLSVGGADDPVIAWHRFLVASHRFGECHCEESMRSMGLNRQQRRERMKQQRRNLAAVANTLPRRGEADPESLQPTPGQGL